MRSKYWIGIVVLCLFFLFFLFFLLLVPKTMKSEYRVVDINKGSSVYHISKRLKKQGVIRSSTVFYYYVRFFAKDKHLRAGSFRLSSSQSLVRIVELLQEDSGVAALVKVGIPEGYSIRDIAQVLDKKGMFELEAFYQYASVQAKDIFVAEFPFLKDIPVNTLEGYLFPDTYFFAKGDSMEVVIRTMLREFERNIVKTWQEAEVVKGMPKARFDFHRVLTIASLIEKEAAVGSEMPLISSVFYNRLKKRMPLASDPTVVYALGKSYKKRVYYKDLKIDSPYNTYKYSGFPPSAIASPGLAAFKASLAPVSSPYLFFVATTGGAHYFSKTYVEHLAVQRKKQK
ncbi:MAG: endolytic transglycosylase MltG [bacterium]